MKNKGNQTDFRVIPPPKLLTSRDWFHSHLYRSMMYDVYRKRAMDLPEQVVQQFEDHDRLNRYLPILEERRGHTHHEENDFNSLELEVQ